MHTQRLPVHDPGGLGIFALMAQALIAPYSPRSSTTAGRHSTTGERRRR